MCCTAAICADSLGLSNVIGTLLYSYDSRLTPVEYTSAPNYNTAYSTMIETIRAATLLISIHIQRQTERIPAAHDAPFPFKSKRPGQVEFMTEALKTYKNGTKLLCEAPTGIGKTMSSLFPAVKAFGHRFIDKIFYLTPKTTAQYAAENAVKAIFPQEDGIRSIILSAKDKMCLISDPTPLRAEADTPESEGKSYREHSKCERCSGSIDYYSRRCQALYELLCSDMHLTPQKVSDIAKKYTVCPYELSLDASEYCDIVICDYNYLFDCRVYLRRYFDMFDGVSASSKKHLPSYAVLVDEAHNLPDRARNMYSHTLRTSSLRRVLSDFGPTEQEQRLKRSLEELISHIDSYDKSCLENSAPNEKGEICGFCICQGVDEGILTDVSEYIEKYDALKRADNTKIPPSITDLYFGFRDLVKKSEYFSDKFRVLCEKTGNNINYRIMCLDPSEILEEKEDMAKATVMFSATLSPVDYYMRSLGLNKGSHSLVAASPYDRKNFSLTVFDTVSTRYNDRKETLYNLTRIIHTATNAKRGNYMVFFPSYKYMEEVHSFFCAMYPNIATIIQKKGMTDEQRSNFVARFDENNTETLVGFCVLGGVYAEGIDLVGERLIGSIIVGVGMPRLSNERNILVEYYNDKDEEGMLYSYVYPGMTRVMQAVGRVIRSESDKGIAVLIDDRFSLPLYKSLFPEHWRHAKFVSQPSALHKMLDRFWTDEKSGDRT